MQTNFLFSVATCSLLAIAALDARTALAQVPTRSTQPVLAPAREPQTLTPGQPTVPAPEAIAPASQPGAIPVAAPAVAPDPAGVTPVPATAPATSSSSQAATSNRSYVAGAYALTLEGTSAGLLRKVDGGFAASDVVIERLGPDNIAKKHIAGVRYEDLSFDTGFESKQILDWIAASWKGSSLRKNGSVLAADYSGNVQEERQFTHALLTATTIPALDASGREPGYLKVTISPETVRESAGSGKITVTGTKTPQRGWLASNFRFEMSGLDGSRVNRIASFTVGQKVVDNPVGEQRAYEKEVGGMVFPDLNISLAAVNSESWANWHQDFVIKGNNGDAQEKNGAIVFLDHTRSKELGRISLFNCGIYRFGAPPMDAKSESVRRMIADLYCERMEFVPQP
jgi:hypothetical protein